MTVLSGQPISIEETAQRCAVSLVDSVPVVVVTGHYGVGKTNFSLNLALDAAAAGRNVTLIDLDVVNPYFRSSEYREMMEAAGIRLIAPVFAERGSNLDVPSLTGAIVPAIQMAQHAWEARLSEGSEVGRRRSPSEFRSDENSPVDCSPKRGLSERLNDADPPRMPLVIIDAGGDDAGATALARFAPTIKQAPYQLFYLVNRYRTLTQDPEGAVRVLRAVEEASDLLATAVVGSSHLMGDTDAEVVREGIAFASRVADAAGLPLACAT